MKKLSPSEAGAALGRLSAGKPKHYTPEELQRRADLARGLAARRQSKPVKTRHVVIDRAGRKWPYLAENVQDAIFLAKADGIHAVGAKEERE